MSVDSEQPATAPLDPAPSNPSREALPKPSASDRLKALVAEWGPLFLVVWFSLFAVVMVGFVLAIQLGFEVEGSAGGWGNWATWVAAWGATQLTKPLRIAATLVITPALGAFLRRFKRPGQPNAEGEPALDESPSRR